MSDLFANCESELEIRDLAMAMVAGIIVHGSYGDVETLERVLDVLNEAEEEIEQREST